MSFTINSSETNKLNRACGPLHDVKLGTMMSEAQADIADNKAGYCVSVPIVATGTSPLSTHNQGILAVSEDITVKDIRIGFVTAPDPGENTITLAVGYYDTAGNTSTNLLESSTFDLDGTTSNIACTLALTTTTENLNVDAGEFIYAQVVAQTLTTAGDGGVLTLRYELR